MNYNNIIKKSLKTGLYSRVLQVLYALISVPLILNGLGIELYGIWILISQVIGYFVLMDIGVSNSLARFLSKFLITKNSKDIDALYTTVFYYLLTISLTIFIISIVFQKEIFVFFNIPCEINNIVAFFIAIFSFIISLPLKIYIGIAYSYHKVYLIDYSLIVITLVKLVGILMLSYFNILNILFLAIIVFVFDTLRYFIIRHYLNIKINYKFSLFSISLLKKIFSLGLASFLISSFAYLYTQIPVFLISEFIDIKSIILYSIPFLIVYNLMSILSRVGSLFTPISSELIANNEIDLLEKLASKYVGLLLFISLLIYVGFNTVGYMFIELWLINSIDISLVNSINNNLEFLLIPSLFFASLLPYRNILMSTGYHNYVLVANFALLIVVSFITYSFDFFLSIEGIIEMLFILYVFLSVLFFILVYFLFNFNIMNGVFSVFGIFFIFVFTYTLIISMQLETFNLIFLIILLFYVIKLYKDLNEN